MLTAFTNNISAKKLFSLDEKLLVAVSGGIDSVVLVHLLEKAGYSFSIAHCNFQLRGEEANNDEKFVRQLAQKKKAPFFVNHFQTKEFAKKNKLSIQMAARQLRYDWFRELMKEMKFAHLLTAHHLNDNVETLLLNLTRGTGLPGLTGIPEKQDGVVRPLLIFTREEIEAYAKKNKIKHREDSSNYEEKYARNLIRAKIIPVLKKINPSLEKTFLENIGHFKQSDQLIKNVLKEKRNKIVQQANNEIKISISSLNKEKEKSLLLLEILSDYGFNPKQISSIERMTSSIAGKIIESDNFTLITGRGEIIVRKKTNEDFKEIEVRDFNEQIKNPDFSFKIKENKNFNFPKDKNIACFDLEKIGSSIKIRKWKQGDRFHPFGMKGSKKLSDFFVSEKMNFFEKQKTLVISAGDKIAWVVGRRIDERFAVTDTTKKILVIHAE